MSIYIGMTLEVVLVSLFLSVFVCIIRQRIRNRQTALLLRNSVYHLGINVFLLVQYSIGAAYYIYTKSHADLMVFSYGTYLVCWQLVYL